MATLTSLPPEMINIILSCSDISFEDIINFKCVCKYFQWALSVQTKKTRLNGEAYYFPEEKYLQRWPSAKKYDDQYNCEDNGQKNFEKNKQKDEKYIDSFITIGIGYAKELRNYMRIRMSVFKSINITGEGYLEGWEERLFETMFINNYNLKILFIIDEIKHLLAEPPRVGCDLTEKYHYINLFIFMRENWRENILEKFKERSHEELSEQSATILAQQLRPGKYASYSSVRMSLNNIALEALNFLRKKHPKHSIFSTSDECFSDWENNNINNNFWNEAEGIQVMDTLEEYMIDEMNFRPTSSKELEYMCIDYVLENKYGNEIILLLIYQSVARRLGLRCDLVTTAYQMHCIALFWMPNYIFTTDYKDDISILIKERYKESNVRFFNIASQHHKFPICLLEDCRLNEAIYKKPLSEILQISVTIEYRGYSRDDFVKDILTIPRAFKAYDRERPQEVKFAVGMIVTHGDESTDCSTGVIIGWYKDYFHDFKDFFCTISHHIMPLKVCRNYSAAYQLIYYVILTKSNKLCHVEQDDITLTKPKPIKNRNIYQYFYKFEGTHYVPSKDLAGLYPHDAAIIAKTIFEN